MNVKSLSSEYSHLDSESENGDFILSVEKTNKANNNMITTI